MEQERQEHINDLIRDARNQNLSDFSPAQLAEHLRSLGWICKSPNQQQSEVSWKNPWK